MPTRSPPKLPPRLLSGTNQQLRLRLVLTGPQRPDQREQLFHPAKFLAQAGPLSSSLSPCARRHTRRATRPSIRPCVREFTVSSSRRREVDNPAATRNSPPR